MNTLSVTESVKVQNIKNRKLNRTSIAQALRKNYQLYILALPAVVYVFIFCYIPMYGVQIAFKDYNFAGGISGSPWVRFQQFSKFFHSYQFITTLKNTLELSIYLLVINFPFPIIFALLLNQVQSLRFKKFMQTVTYAPHFISMVVMVGMIIIMLSPTSGVINKIIELLGGETVNFMGENSMFKTIYVFSDLWQQLGWSSIIYLAALSAIDPALYDASNMDGAGKFKQMLHIDLPGIMPTVIIMLILAMGRIMSMGMQKAYLMQNPLNLGSSEIISTYIYKAGLLQSQYSYSAAVGLFESLINIMLLVAVNAIAKRFSETSLW